MNAESFIKAQLVAFAHREAAQHGGIDNMLAVMHVIRNRYYASWEGGDWLRIIHAADKAAGCAYPERPVDLRDINVKLVLSKVDDIFGGFAPDPYTEGALYYAELNKVERDWFKREIASDPTHHPRCATVGPVTFFK